MIIPKLPTKNILFVGGDGFYDMKIPETLNTTLQHLPYERSTGLTPGGESVDLAVIKHIDGNRTDAIMVIPQPFVDKVCKSAWVNEAIKRQIPIGFMWYDALIYQSWVEDMSNHSLNIVLDDQKCQIKNSIPIWTPIAEDSPRSPAEERPIDVCFIGNVDCDQRKNALNYLLNKGVHVFTAGNQDWNRLNHWTMHQYLRMSKITLNFSQNRFTNKSSLKGRVLEAMLSGSMVVEDANDNTGKYFIPDTDLIWYESLPELVDKVKSHLKDSRRRNMIADHGQYKCIKFYNPNEWWKIVIPKLLALKSKTIKM